MAPRGEEALTWRGRSPGCAEELEEAVRRLRAEEDAERVAAALRAELGARLQREKAADMMEARELRGLAEGRAGRDRELQDRLAASYAALLRAHGSTPTTKSAEEIIITVTRTNIPSKRTLQLQTETNAKSKDLKTED